MWRVHFSNVEFCEMSENGLNFPLPFPPGKVLKNTKFCKKCWQSSQFTGRRNWGKHSGFSSWINSHFIIPNQMYILAQVQCSFNNKSFLESNVQIINFGIICIELETLHSSLEQWNWIFACVKKKIYVLAQKRLN